MFQCLEHLSYKNGSRPYITNLEIKKIFNKLNESLNKHTNCENLLEDYLFFLKNNITLLKINNIFLFLKNEYKIKNSEILTDFKLTIDQKNTIITLFLSKSMHKVFIRENDKFVQSHGFFSSDEVLNDILNSFVNLYIFYLKRELLHSEFQLLKGEIFKIIKILIAAKLLESRTSFKNNKTLEEWSLGISSEIIVDYSYLKIATEPFEVVSIAENYYLIGNFFTIVKKIFVENIKSDYYFKLNDIKYIENMVNNEVYLNVNDLEDLILLFKKNNLSMENIEKSSNLLNNEIIENNKKIKINEILCKKNLMNKIKGKVCNTFIIDSTSKNFIEAKKFILNEFYDYVLNFLNIEKNEVMYKKEIINLIYSFFKNEFKNAYLKTKFKSIEELIEWKDKFKEYGIFLNENETIKNKKMLNENLKENKLKINEKINPARISFITYLYIYSKKEIDNLLKKEKNSLIKTINNFSYYDLELVNWDKIELNENSNIGIYNLLINSSLKFDLKTKQDIKIIQIRNEIRNLNFENKKNQSKISKWLHIYNIFILYAYCRRKELVRKIDSHNNIKIFFLFFFDFRGRFYYDSLISPTTNKFCRFIYNYGILYDTNKEKKINEISLVIDQYKDIIKNISDELNIRNSQFNKECIFWTLISLGKLKLDKKKNKTSLNEFLEIGFKLIKKQTEFKDLIDLAEYNYYIKILSSLKGDSIIRRPLLKDATASFFQNLIRILGAKNEEAEKIANLKSNTYWYDWYSHIINEWVKNEIINNTYNEEKFLMFNRKTLKKSIMTLPYSATFKSCFDYFRESIFEEFQIEININDDFFEIFKRFYIYLNNYMKKQGPYKNSTEEITNHFKKILLKGDEIVIISRNNDKSNLTYFKTTTKHFDFILKWEDKKIRSIKNYMQLTNTTDVRKTTTALKANLVHFVDALLVRDINFEIFEKEKKNYMSIHDSFMVDFTNVSEFIIIANKCVNKTPFLEEIWDNEKNFFSIFLFL